MHVRKTETRMATSRLMPAKTVRRSGSGRHSAGRDKAFEALVGPLKGLAETIDSLSGRAVPASALTVGELVHSRSRDVRRIEATLDDLLGFCGYEPALDLYKTLCRHYLSIDPAATAKYVYMYRDMWDAPAVKGDALRKRTE